MPKALHEIRDPIHNFIRVEGPERAVLDSRPFQRLRHIHQLAMAYLIYPGATHRRFEHSLGVMELAGRVFDVITQPANATEAAREVIPANDTDRVRWRRTLRMAALCHDIGHLPFSHAAEGLLPAGWDHERLTDALVLGEEMKPVWRDLGVIPEQVAKLAVGPKKLKHRAESFSPWEAILTEIVIGDAFGVDRMDYLLRDSYHANSVETLFAATPRTAGRGEHGDLVPRGRLRARHALHGLLDAAAGRWMVVLVEVDDVHLTLLARLNTSSVPAAVLA